MRTSIYLCSFVVLFFIQACQASAPQEKEEIVMGAEQTKKYLHLLDNKRVGLVVNHTSMLGDVHLVDFLREKGVNVVKIFTPEHGFRGTADAGEKVESTMDAETGLPIVSLYGSNKKPSAASVADVDVLIFDIQDVGVRFYTYISTMHYMMETCAEQHKLAIVFDRPNPNGHYVDGPILNMKFTSFVGMHPIPVVHGLTVAELALMINGEGWLAGGLKCRLEVVPMQNYHHKLPYSLPVKPSPNLPNDRSINLYPSTCFFEGTKMSLGRGTQYPFQILGYPDASFGDFCFTPKSIVGMSKNPPHEQKECCGVDLREGEFLQRLDLSFLLHFYAKWNKKEDFFTSFFNLLAGNDVLVKQIKDGKTEDEIRISWQPGLDKYHEIRSKYLLYKEPQ